MIELYSVKDVAQLFGQRESRLRYWIQSGFLWPSVRRRGQYFYTFEDLVTIKTAIELLDSGLSVQKVRVALNELRKELPNGIKPDSRLRICSDGSKVVVVKDDMAYEPKSKQLVMAFEVSSIQNQIADVLPIRPEPEPEAVPLPIEESSDHTTKEQRPSAYQLFLHACHAEEAGRHDEAERLYRECLDQEESMAAALTNLGNLLHRKGELDEAKSCYDKALLHEPEQAEARFNLGNLLDEQGNTDMAIAELRQVCSRQPDFADAHYNLGILLARVGGHGQAGEHLQRYLELDSDSRWAEQAREFLSACS